VKIKTLILNKLNSKKGSALLLAMLFSLMCIILGMVVLSAGEASNGRIVNAAKAEQSYYVTSSLFRQFQHEATWTHADPTNPAETVPEDMQLRVDAARINPDSASFDLNSLFVAEDSHHNLTTLQTFIAEGLYKAMTVGSYENELTYTLGGQGGMTDQYVAKVKMTIRDTDYSIYLDVTDVIKGDAETGESLGAAHLHTIALQCKRITPKAAGSDGRLTDAIFEYYQAKLLQ